MIGELKNVAPRLNLTACREELRITGHQCETSFDRFERTFRIAQMRPQFRRFQPSPWICRFFSQGTLRTLMRLFNFPQMKPYCTKTIKEDAAAGSRSFSSPKNGESADAVFILVQIKAGMRAHQCTLEILISRFAREAPFHDASIYDGIDFSQNSPRPNFIARVEGSQFGSIFI